MGPYCNGTLPPAYISENSAVEVVFYSDSALVSEGFRIEWQSLAGIDWLNFKVFARIFCLSMLSSCHRAASDANCWRICPYFFIEITTLCLEDICNCFKSFQCFSGFHRILSTEFSVQSKPSSRDNHHKACYPRTQQVARWPGCELNANHAIRFGVKTTPLPSRLSDDRS